MEIDKVLVGKAIARLREERNLTQSQLNGLVGMSTIQHIEQGRNSVSLTCLNKIASALDIPAACIVLLGSKIDEGDRVLSSLRSLLEKTLSLGIDGKLTGKGAKDKKAAKRTSNGGEKKIALLKKHKPVVV